MTNQPIWKLEFNLGDVNPIEHGGMFVYTDTTGVYPPECEILTPDDGDGNAESWEVIRFILEPLKSGTIHREWFYDDLADVGSFVGSSRAVMIADLCGDDLARRAHAWRAIGDYHGMDNLDSYPLTFTDRAELEKRYSSEEVSQ